MKKIRIDLDAQNAAGADFREDASITTGNGSFQTCKAEFEQDYIKKLLLANEGNISKASKTAGMDRRSLQRLIQKGKLLSSSLLK